MISIADVFHVYKNKFSTTIYDNKANWQKLRSDIAIDIMKYKQKQNHFSIIPSSQINCLLERSLQKVDIYRRPVKAPNTTRVTWWRHQMELFSRHLPFGWGIHRSAVNSPHKDQWRRALIFSLICAWINGLINNREAGDLRRHCSHSDVTVMSCHIATHFFFFCDT